MESVYCLENRGFIWIWHWFFLILSGLRFLEKDDKKVKIYMPWFKDYGFHNDSLKYFDDKFDFQFETPREGVSIQYFHGEPLVTRDRIAKDGYLYIRNKLLRGKSYTVVPGKRVYITRRGSEQLVSHNGVAKRQVLNESELCNLLSVLNIEVVRLELLNVEEKIRLFRESEIILAPIGSGLTLVALMEPTQKVIEFMSPSQPSDMKHCKVICEELSIPYYSFSNVNFVDSNDNLNLKLDDLNNLLSTILN